MDILICTWKMTTWSFLKKMVHSKDLGQIICKCKEFYMAIVKFIQSLKPTNFWIQPLKNLHNYLIMHCCQHRTGSDTLPSYLQIFPPYLFTNNISYQHRYISWLFIIYLTFPAFFLYWIKTLYDPVSENNMVISPHLKRLSPFLGYPTQAYDLYMYMLSNSSEIL